MPDHSAKGFRVRAPPVALGVSAAQVWLRPSRVLPMPKPEPITAAALTERLAALPPGRWLVALAGAPASGKSTLAEALVEGLNTQRPGRAAVLPMDGFHYDNQVLEPRGHLPRKGAPHTFDVAGLRHMLQRLKDRDEAEVAIPVFDRSIEIARAGAAILSREIEIVVVEGNYLLLDRDPWTALHGLFDVTVAFEVPEDVLRARLAARWESYDLSPARITEKLEENDLPNGRLVREESIPADYVIYGQ